MKGADKILEICKILKADTYYNAIGGMKLYDKKLFKDNGIDIMFLRTDDTLSYSQFQQMDFIPNLSIIDILMFNSPAETNSLLDRYFLV